MPTISLPQTFSSTLNTTNSDNAEQASSASSNGPFAFSSSTNRVNRDPLLRQPGNPYSQALRMPHFFKRLFKFPQMDFELAIWEMTSLIIAPKKVFRNVVYHKQTGNTYHRGDPSFTYLLSLFLSLTAVAWALAYSTHIISGSFLAMIVFVGLQFLATSLIMSAFMYFFVARRILTPGSKIGNSIARFMGRRGLRGRFGAVDGGVGARERNVGGNGDSNAGGLEFGYCFDVSIRAFFPVWLFLYVLQFLLMPVIWNESFLERFFGNVLYLLAFGYYFVITFLGYNALPFLHNTEVLLAPISLVALIWLISIFKFNLPIKLAPIYWSGASLRID